MKSKVLILLSLSILSLVILMSYASAAELELNLVDGPTTTDHNTDVTITFNISASNATVNYTALNWSGSTTNIGSWKTLPSLTSINMGETHTLTAILEVPQYASGTIDAVIDLQDETTSITQLTVPSITITSTPSLTITETTPITKTQNGTITVTNNGNEGLTSVALTPVDTADFTVSFDISNFDLAAGTSQIVKLLSTDVQNLKLSDDNSLKIRATSGTANSTDLVLTVPVKFYEGENKGDLRVTNIDFSVKSGFGDDNKYWYPLDEIEASVDIDNKGDWDLKKIEIEACLLDLTTGKCVMTERDMDLSDDRFKLRKNDGVTIKLNFSINPGDLNSGDDNYEFHINAVGKIDDKDAGEFDGDSTGNSDLQDIEVRTTDSFIIINDFQYPETIPCKEELKVSADVWNIGDNRIDGKDVYVQVYNKELEIDEVINNLGDLRALDKEVLDFSFNMPKDAEEKIYTLTFKVYDSKDLADKHLYENSESDRAEFDISLKVEGSCKKDPTAAVSANLESGGQAGKEMVIKATVTNTGEDITTYSLNAAGYTQWATLLGVEPGSIVINSGDSKDVLITLNVKKDVLGEQNFDIEVISDGQLVLSQPVSVTIEEKKGFGSITGSVIGGGNAYLWGIGLLNIILVIIIILVAVKIARK